MRFVVVLALVAAVGGVAHAQKRATDGAIVEPVDRGSGPPAGLGLSFTFGWAGQVAGKDGWSARLDEEIYPFYMKHGLFGFLMGFETWKSGEDNWGFSVPFAVVGGARVEPFRAMVGVGFDAMLIDQVNDDTGFGMYAPLALARLGLDIDGFQAGVDARIGYRWQIGADDHGRWQVGFYLAKTMATPERKKRVAKVAR